MEELVEKHSIIDVMFYGKDIMHNLEQKQFKISSHIINTYSNHNHIDTNRIKNMKILHFKML